MQSEQEKFWAGDFGREYIERNNTLEMVANNTAFFANSLRRLDSRINNVLEIGSNIGINYYALLNLFPNIRYKGIEINPSAAQMTIDAGIDTFQGSVFEYNVEEKYEIVVSKGVLIHQNPELVTKYYEQMHKLSSRYIFIAEYFNPSQVEVKYRGHDGKLFKRDWCKDFLNQYPSSRLVDYGFAYSRDIFPQDDITWFIIEK